jgi:hypothetical protein
MEFPRDGCFFHPHLPYCGGVFAGARDLRTALYLEFLPCGEGVCIRGHCARQAGVSVSGLRRRQAEQLSLARGQSGQRHCGARRSRIGRRSRDRASADGTSSPHPGPEQLLEGAYYFSQVQATAFARVLFAFNAPRTSTATGSANYCFHGSADRAAVAAAVPGTSAGQALAFCAGV